MATFFNNSTVAASNSTDALFRAWVGFIDAALTGGGWVNTADTGQMTIATALHPTVANTDVGFRIYRMADTLQATKPIYLKIGYGATSVANVPRLNISAGTGTDGAGNLTGVLFTGFQPACNTNTVTIANNYASSDTNRLQLLMFIRTGVNDVMALSIERTKDATGADTGDGLLITWGNAGQIVFTSYINTTPGAQPPVELGVTTVLSNQTGATSFSGDVGVGVPLHFKSIIQQPGLGMVVVNSADFVAQATVSFTFYSATHTFQLGDSATSQIGMATGNNTFASRPTTRIGIRFE